MNVWHDVEIGDKYPDVVRAIIEVPKGSQMKYELDKKSGLLKLDRVLYSAVHYPGNYGFIPRTYAPDSDPLDIIIIGSHSMQPMCLVDVRPIGVIELYDDNEEDDKIICVHNDDPRYKDIHELSDIEPHLLLEMRNFFETYKALQKKEVKVVSVKGRKRALTILKASVKAYQKKFSSE